MKILLLANMFPPEIRSAARLMSELAESLVGRGHRVTVVTSARGGRPRGVEMLSGVRVVRVPTLAVQESRAPAVLRGLGQLFNSAAYGPAALSVRDVDVSLSYSPPLALGMVGALLHRLRGVPHVLNVQDLVPQYAIDLGMLKNPALIRMLRWIERAVYRNVQLITVHSRGNAEVLARQGVPAGKMALVPNWVDTRRLRPSPRDNAYRRKAGLEGKFVALFSGHLGFAQDLDSVVEAGALLRERSEIALLIVGEGIEKRRLEEKARKLGLANVRFMPAVSEDDYPQVVASADVCLATLQPSLRCPVVPAKLLGYMAAGKPIIASFPEGGDAPRLVRDAGCGVCAPPGDPARLAQAILDAAERPAESRARGEHGRRYVEANHDRERAMDVYESLFERLIGRGQKRRAA